MLIVAMKSGHDGAIAAVEDGRLILSFETEKDSFPRHFFLAPETVIAASAVCDRLPDIVAIGGWHRGRRQDGPTGAGYFGLDNVSITRQRFFGYPVTAFSSSHERSHVMMAIGMAPPIDGDRQVVLAWEGDIGAFYLADRTGRSVSRMEVLPQPGARYALLYALADPTYPPGGTFPRLEDAGKLMALAAYGRSSVPANPATNLVDAILSLEDCYSTPKAAFRNHPLYNAGVEHPLVAAAAAHLTDRLFEIFAAFALERLPASLDLRISGGCGLNCEWNRRWQDLGHFRSVFVPPCTDDSGSAIGTAIDALLHATGEPWIRWSCYSGPEFVNDLAAPPDGWHIRPLDLQTLAARLSDGAVVAWVQGRSEIGPRALGHRSLLAEPFSAATRDQLNRIKRREPFRPIAPCCAVEDIGRVSPDTFEDPYMLYFRPLTESRLGAVTHVDGSARVQTVSEATNAALHRLLLAFGRQTGLAVLCNTSLNRKGCGFINRSSMLFDYCSQNGIDDAVVNGTWFTFERRALKTEGRAAAPHRSRQRLS